jgi:hypothetical protein
MGATDTDNFEPPLSAAPVSDSVTLKLHIMALDVRRMRAIRSLTNAIR